MESLSEPVSDGTQAGIGPVASVDGWVGCDNSQPGHRKACLGSLLDFGTPTYSQAPAEVVVEVVTGDETPSQTSKPLTEALDGSSVFGTERAYHIHFLCDSAEKESP